jgi:predicted tellurium resistance membrane protein TerC
MISELFELLLNPAVWIALITLVVMEVVLGIDNLLFISIQTNKLPEQQRSSARRIGLSAALLMRLGMLGSLTYIAQLTTPIFTLFGQPFSMRDVILIGGGLFLLWKATKEIHHRVDPSPAPDIFDNRQATLSFGSVIAQILLLDAVFSIDSILTAIGMTPHVPVMMIAIIVSVIVMLLAADPLANFLADNPSIIMLALGFLLMIGTVLIAEGFGAHIPKGYIYTAIAFAGFIEGLNVLAARARKARGGDKVWGGASISCHAYLRPACAVRSSKSSCSIRRAAAAAFSSRCETWLVPGIGNMTGERLMSQASAI